MSWDEMRLHNAVSGSMKEYEQKAAAQLDAQRSKFFEKGLQNEMSGYFENIGGVKSH